MLDRVDKLAMKCKMLGSPRGNTLELLGEKISFYGNVIIANVSSSDYYEGNLYDKDIEINKKQLKKLKDKTCSNNDTRQAYMDWKSSKGDKYISCINSLHVLLDRKTSTWNLNVYIRSSDAIKKLKSDIAFLHYIATEKLGLPSHTYKLNITFGSIHIYKDDIKMHNKPKCIFFDGLDKTGKTAVQKILFKMRDKIDFIADRFMISPMAFNIIYDRTWVIGDYSYMETLKANKDATFFYFRANATTIFDRCIEHKEMQLQEFSKVKHQLQVFDMVAEQANTVCKINTIDTTTTKAFDAAWDCYMILKNDKI